jgi:hypothetical protein
LKVLPAKERAGFSGALVEFVERAVIVVVCLQRPSETSHRQQKMKENRRHLTTRRKYINKKK